MKIGRAAVWLDCKCGSEVEIQDAETDGVTYETVTCEDCGKTARVRVDVEIWEGK